MPVALAGTAYEGSPSEATSMRSNWLYIEDPSSKTASAKQVCSAVAASSQTETSTERSVAVDSTPCCTEEPKMRASPRNAGLPLRLGVHHWRPGIHAPKSCGCKRASVHPDRPMNMEC